MNRKEFIVKSAGTVAALTLSKWIHAQQIESPTEGGFLFFYKHVKETKNGSVFDVQYFFEISDSLKNCEEGVIKLRVSQLPEGISDESLSQVAIYTAQMKKCKPEGEFPVYASIKCKKWDLQEGPNLLQFTSIDKSLKRKFILELSRRGDTNYLELKRKKKSLLYAEEYEIAPESSGSDDGCYLTTICVEHLRKPDDCYELNTLRRFRDEYVSKFENGEWVKKYYEIAPGIVEFIRKQKHAENILSLMYNDLVLHTIQRIERNDLKGAMDYYMDYSMTLSGLISDKTALISDSYD